MSEKSAPPLERTSSPFEEPAGQDGARPVVGLREAELEYPITRTVADCEKEIDVGAVTSMALTARESQLGTDATSLALRGLLHWETGDDRDSPALPIASSDPFLDRVRRLPRGLLTDGQERVRYRGGSGDLPYSPIDVRIVRRVRTMEVIAKIEMWARFSRDLFPNMSDLPHCEELIDNGVGRYFANPATVPSGRLAWVGDRGWRPATGSPRTLAVQQNKDGGDQRER